MTEVPEHLLAKAREARERKAADTPSAGADTAEDSVADDGAAAGTAEPDTDTDTDAEVEPDEAREALLAVFADGLGEALVAHDIAPGRGLWLRVRTEAWLEAAQLARHRARCGFFDWLSAVDWLPSPFGRDMDSQEDRIVAGETAAREPDPIERGVTGGDTRFQVLFSVRPASAAPGVILKADVPDETLAVDSLIPAYAGANWHEREAWEMYGITFVGHPDVRHIYLPGEFEGYPLRKDYPLLARRIKPWPGIVDVEGMPGEEGS